MPDEKQIENVPWDTTDGRTTRVSAQPEQAKSAEVSVEPKPIAASRLTNQEIVAEVRELHSHFKELESAYKAAPADQRPHLREEMEPLVERERALRQEYTGRSTPELKQDQVPQQSIGYGR